VSEQPPLGEDPGRAQPQNIAATITDISERATELVRDEIELAKVELTEKATKLARGAVVGVAAGIFFATALVFALVGCAWLLYYYLPGNDFTYFWGFFAMAVILVLLGVLAGLIAARAVKKGSPPVPTMAIEEARLIRETVESPPQAASYGAAASGSAAGSESAAPIPSPAAASPRAAQPAPAPPASSAAAPAAASEPESPAPQEPAATPEQEASGDSPATSGGEG